MSKSRKQRSHRRAIEDGNAPALEAARKHEPVVSQGPRKADVYYLSDIEVTWDPLEDEDVKALPASVRHRMASIYRSLRTKPGRFEKELRGLIRLYPDIMTFQNWLSVSLRASGKGDEAKELCEAMFRNHPDYLFGRLTLAEMALEAFDLETAERILMGDGATLPAVCGGRKLFHISEVRNWYFSCGKMYLFQGNLEGAKSHRDLLHELEPNHPVVHELDRLMRPENLKLLQMLPTLRQLKDLAREEQEKEAAVADETDLFGATRSASAG